MEECHAQHDCMAPFAKYELPTRLLYIDRGELRLVALAQLLSHIRYATLSHCWGQHQPLKLLKSNIKCLESNVPHDFLCKTLKDSVAIASRVGLKHIWIDSLCIVQDDEEDWRKESVLMANIYGNFYLNIAAAGASNGGEGCFFQQGVKELRLMTSEDGEVQFFDCVPKQLYKLCTLFTPLAQRGSALHERLLAPRTIHFGRFQLY